MPAERTRRSVRPPALRAGTCPALAICLPALTLWALPPMMRSAGAATPEASPDAPAATADQPDERAAALTADAYRAIFARLPETLVALDTPPTGRGLNSWTLFVDHPELVTLADALVLVSQRPKCDFEPEEPLVPSIEHHRAYLRAKNLLLHRAAALLLGDRTAPPNEDGTLPPPTGVDVDGATRYAVAALNLAEHLAQRGTLAERRISATVPSELLGIARRVPQGLSWGLEALRASRILGPLQTLFNYRDAAVARLRLLADAARTSPDDFAREHGLTPATGSTEDPAHAAMIERYHAVFNELADALNASWDDNAPARAPFDLMRRLPDELTTARVTLLELARGAIEIAAVRDDIAALLPAPPTPSTPPPSAD
jgi:hypothetical protein